MTNTNLLPIAHHAPLSPNPFLAKRTVEQFKFPLMLILLHLPLGIALYNSGLLAVVHPYAALAVGLYWAIDRRIKLERAAFAAAYIVGAEVLWRMAYANIFWEFGKYGAAAIMIVALVRRGYTKIPTLPLLYMLLLLPACILTFINNDIVTARDRISFNLSGAFFLLVSCWFFSYCKINLVGLQKLFFALIIPLLSIAVTTLFYTVTASNIQFNDESNFATSGGFGPNQVSAMLGLGAFLCIAGYAILKLSFSFRVFLGVMIIFFATQSVLTFSRGGMYNAVGASLILIGLQLRNPNSAIKKILPIIGIGALFVLMIFPFLNNFTGGNLQDRFEDSDSTHRVELIETDFQVFMENPVLGVGVGAARESRAEILEFKAASHTEFSRMISEHGIFGLLSIVALLLTILFNMRRAKSNLEKAFIAGVVVWSFLFMLNAGMRLAAPSLIWGLSFLTFSNPPVAGKRVRRIEEREI